MAAEKESGSGEKEIVKCFRLTRQEERNIEKRCRLQEISFSEYMRLLIKKDTGKIIVRKTKSAYQQDKQLIEEIRRIGVNINQIARSLNEGYRYSAEDKARLFCFMEDIKELLKKKTDVGGSG